MSVKRLLLCMLTLCLIPALALAAVRTENAPEGSDKLETLLVHFEEEAPADISALLAQHGWQDARCLYGAAVLRRTLARVIAHQEGESFPWYQVQVGNTIGWISGPYLTYARDQADFARRISYQPLPVARVKERVLLRKELNSEKAVMYLEPGMLMHLLGETENGWLHVCVPRGELHWLMDQGGSFGYVRKSEADVADSPLALP